MRRIEVASGIWVVDYESGIGGECYVPPNPKSQPSFGSVTSPEDIVAAVVSAEQSHIVQVQSEGWKTVSQAVIAAATGDQKCFPSYEVGL